MVVNPYLIVSCLKSINMRSTWLVISFLVKVFVSSYASSDINRGLPSIHGMDDYSACKREDGLYCKFSYKLYPDMDDNFFWQIIQTGKKNPYTFHRDIFYRYRCIPQQLQGKNEEILRYIKQREDNLLKNISLYVQITHMECQKLEIPFLKENDMTFIYVLLSYLTLIFVSTFYHFRIMYSKQRHKIKVNEYLLCFSIKRNWEKFTQPVTHSDYLRLKSFQGLRIFCLLGVIGGHTILSLTTISTINPDFLENLYMNPLFRYFIHFGVHFVQIYFLMSAWLLADILFPQYFGDKKISIGTLFQNFTVRYVRLVGPLVLLVLFGRTTFYTFLETGPQAEHIHLNYASCNYNGWATLFLVNCYFRSVNQCHFISWYTSNDFQLFFGTLILLHITRRCKFTKKQFLGVLTLTIGISWILNAVIIYMNDFQVIVGTTPEKSKLENTLASFETFAMYTAIYGNIGGYCVGLIAGAFYNDWKCRSVEMSKWLQRCGTISFIMIFLSMFDYSPFFNAVIGASMKPMFNAGIACFLLGMALSKENGILRRVLECRYFELLAKLSYSTYLSHYWITFGQEMLFDKMFELSYIKLFSIYFIDVFLSFPLGLMVFILFENPLRGILGVFMKKSSCHSPEEDLNQDPKKD